ncbi:MAG: DHHW family protein [Myxococcaceae bacterium]|nr:DHHW family protein [Myxococcaceae bacterium]
MMARAPTTLAERTSRLAVAFSALLVPALTVVLGAWQVVAPSRERVSLVEGRALAGWPEFSSKALWSGAYTRDVELAVADHFPQREAFVRFTFAVRARFGLRAESTVYASKGGALGGFERPEDWISPAPQASSGGFQHLEPVEVPAPLPDDGLAPDGGALEVAALPEVVQPAEPEDGGVEPEAPTEKGGVLVHGGRGMMLLSATDDTARAFAKVLDAYGAAFPSVRVYAVMVPGAGAFYLPPSQRDRSADERHNLEVMHQALSSRVTWVDVLGALEPHATEPIYYRTDHHWTGLGAFYGANAMLEAAGLSAVSRDALVWKTTASPPGSLFRMTQDPRLSRDELDTTWVVPPDGVKSVSYGGERYDVPTPRAFIDERAQGYLTFLGGDVPLMAATTGVKNGRRALLVKNSFGNPLAPLLLPHFEQVVAVDYRLYFDTIAALVRRFRITDVFVQNATLTANDPYHRGRLKLVLFTPVSFVDGKPVIGRPR